MPRVLLLLFIALAALCSPATSRAQDAEPPPEYRATIDAAVAEFAEGHHAEARALFRQAHATHPSARTLRGMGMCSFELRDYAEAVHLLSAALTDGRRPLTDEQRAQVQGALTRAEAFVGRFSVSVPEGASIFVDGAGVATLLEPDGALLLSLGAHTVVTRRGTTQLGEVRVEVRGGEREALALVSAEPAPAAEPPVSARLDVPRAEPVVISAPARAPDLAPAIVVVTVGGAALIAGAVLLGVGLSDASAVTNAPMGTPWSSLRGAYERAPLLEGVGGALLGVGAAAAIAGSVMLATETGSAQSEHASLELGVGPGSLVVRGAF